MQNMTQNGGKKVRQRRNGKKRNDAKPALCAQPVQPQIVLTEPRIQESKAETKEVMFETLAQYKADQWTVQPGMREKDIVEWALSKPVTTVCVGQNKLFIRTATGLHVIQLSQSIRPDVFSSLESNEAAVLRLQRRLVIHPEIAEYKDWAIELCPAGGEPIIIDMIQGKPFVFNQTDRSKVGNYLDIEADEECSDYLVCYEIMKRKGKYIQHSGDRNAGIASLQLLHTLTLMKSMGVGTKIIIGAAGYRKTPLRGLIVQKPLLVVLDHANKVLKVMLIDFSMTPENVTYTPILNCTAVVNNRLKIEFPRAQTCIANTDTGDFPTVREIHESIFENMTGHVSERKSDHASERKSDHVSECKSDASVIFPPPMFIPDDAVEDIESFNAYTPGLEDNMCFTLGQDFAGLQLFNCFDHFCSIGEQFKKRPIEGLELSPIGMLSPLEGSSVMGYTHPAIGRPVNPFTFPEAIDNARFVSVSVRSDYKMSDAFIQTVKKRYNRCIFNIVVVDGPNNERAKMAMLRTIDTTSAAMVGPCALRVVTFCDGPNGRTRDIRILQHTTILPELLEELLPFGACVSKELSQKNLTRWADNGGFTLCKFPALDMKTVLFGDRMLTLEELTTVFTECDIYDNVVNLQSACSQLRFILKQSEIIPYKEILLPRVKEVAAEPFDNANKARIDALLNRMSEEKEGQQLATRREIKKLQGEFIHARRARNSGIVRLQNFVECDMLSLTTSTSLSVTEDLNAAHRAAAIQASLEIGRRLIESPGELEEYLMDEEKISQVLGMIVDPSDVDAALKQLVANTYLTNRPSIRCCTDLYMIPMDCDGSLWGTMASQSFSYPVTILDPKNAADLNRHACFIFVKRSASQPGVANLNPVFPSFVYPESKGKYMFQNFTSTCAIEHIRVINQLLRSCISYATGGVVAARGDLIATFLCDLYLSFLREITKNINNVKSVKDCGLSSAISGLVFNINAMAAGCGVSRIYEIFSKCIGPASFTFDREYSFFAPVIKATTMSGQDNSEVLTRTGQWIVASIRKFVVGPHNKQIQAARETVTRATREASATPMFDLSVAEKTVIAQRALRRISLCGGNFRSVEGKAIAARALEVLGPHRRGSYSLKHTSVTLREVVDESDLINDHNWATMIDRYIPTFQPGMSEAEIYVETGARTLRADAPRVPTFAEVFDMKTIDPTDNKVPPAILEELFAIFKIPAVQIPVVTMAIATSLVENSQSDPNELIIRLALEHFQH